MATSDSKKEPWLHELAPFCEALSGLVSLEDKQHTQSTTRFLLRACNWLRVFDVVSPPLSSPEDLAAEARRVRRLRQVLQLISMLAHVDIHAFRQVVVSCFGFRKESVESVGYATERDDEDCDEGLRARFALQLDGDSIAEDVRWPEMLCSELFLSSEFASGGEDDQDEAFRRIMSTMVHSLGIRCGQEVVAVIVPICLEFKPLGVGHDDLVEFLRSVVTIVQKFQAQDAHRRLAVNEPANDRAWAVLYRLESVRVHLNSFEVTTEVASILTTLVSLGVTISALTIRVRESDITGEWCSRLAQGTLYRAITCGSGAPSPQTPAATVNSLTIQGPSVGVAQLAALSSGLAVSDHMTSLNLFSVFDDTSRANRAAKWKWLAYALFSRDSVISVGKLGINGQWMLLEDVEAMITVMQSSHPLQELLTSGSIVAGRNRRVVHLLKDTLIRLAPPEEGGGDEDDDEWASDALSLDRDSQFPIMEDDLGSSCLSILVPGFGECWVDRAAALKIANGHESTTTTLISSSPRAHQVTSFAISIDFDEDGSFAALRRLLSAIGGPLLSIEIFQAYGFAFEYLTDLLRFCPQLRNLYIEGIQLSKDDIDGLIELYETQACVLSSLTLEDYQFESNATLTQLANALSDSSKRIKRTVSELCVGESTEAITMDEANVEAFLTMLQVNKTLLYLELHLPAPLHFSFAGAFEKFNNQDLPVEKRKLPLRSRLALLSISSILSKFELLSQIDERVPARVFDFAAVAATRRIVLRKLPE
ncbi:hypothetical protein Gpo141_00010937 [Globisporangium polare]